MLKKITYSLLVLAVLAFAILFYFLNPIVKTIAGSFLSNTLHTSVNIDKVDIDVFDLRLKANNITVGNIEGFEGNVLDIKEMVLDVGQVSELIIIDELSIDGVVLKVIQSGNNVNLYQWYQTLENKKTTAPAPSNTTTQTNEAPKRIIITKLNLSNIALSIKGDILNYEANLPNISLTSFGKDQGGIALEQLPTELVGLLVASAKNIVKQKTKAELERTKIKVKNKVLEKVNALKNELQNKLKDKFKSLGF